MKRTTQKLMFKAETVRHLKPLDLREVVGGEPTSGKGCLTSSIESYYTVPSDSPYRGPTCTTG